MTYRIEDLTDDDFFPVEWKGVTYTLPKLENLSLDQVDAFSALVEKGTAEATADDLRALFKIIDPEFGDRIGQMTGKQLSGLFEAWQAESGVGLGELSEPSPSSKRTVKRSSTTSSKKG